MVHGWHFGFVAVVVVVFALVGMYTVVYTVQYGKRVEGGGGGWMLDGLASVQYFSEFFWKTLIFH